MEAVAAGVTGFTFPERDVEALVCHVCEILRNNELALRMSHAGPRFVRQHFDIEMCTKKIEDFYDDILSASSAGFEAKPQPLSQA